MENQFSSFFVFNNSHNLFNENLLQKTVDEPSISGFLIGDETYARDEYINIDTDFVAGNIMTLQEGKRIVSERSDIIRERATQLPRALRNAVQMQRSDELRNRARQIRRQNPNLLLGVFEGELIKMDIIEEEQEDATLIAETISRSSKNKSKKGKKKK